MMERFYSEQQRKSPEGPVERSEQYDSGNDSRRREEEWNAGPAGLGHQVEWGFHIAQLLSLAILWDLILEANKSFPET